MKKKILYVASTAGHLNSFHRPYLARLHRDGWIVHIAGRGAAEARFPGVDAGFDISFEKSMFSPKNLTAVRQLITLLRRENYDAVSVHTSLAAFFTRLAVMLSGQRSKLTVINTVHGYLFDQETPWLKRTILLWAEKLTAGATDLLLTMNRQDTEIALAHRLCRGQVEFTRGMGVDFGRFTPADAGARIQAREQFGLPQDAFVLVYAAEFSARKNQQALIRTLSQLPEQVHLLLAGRGGMLEECRTLAKTLGLENRVVFAGFVPDVERCYHAADLCVSTSRSEGLPFNLMEAMHCALPIAATRVKGHEDLVIHGESGFLFSYGQWDELIGYVRQLMEQPALCLRMGWRGRELAEQYALEPVLEENMAVMAPFLSPAHEEKREKISR